MGAFAAHFHRSCGSSGFRESLLSQNRERGFDHLRMNHYTHQGYQKRRELSAIMRRARFFSFWFPVSLSHSLKLSWAIARFFR
jgi:hypothetical protein